MSAPGIVDSSITESISSTEALEIALRLQKAGRLSEAEAIYRKMPAVHPESAETLKDHGNALLSLGRLDEAEQAYRRSLVLNPAYGAAHNNLGNVLRLAGKLAGAEQAFHQALKLLPDCSEVHNNFGNVLMDMERFEEAEQAFRKAIVLDPDYALAHYNRGNALRALERWQTAEKCYRRAIALKPDFRDAFGNLALVLIKAGRLHESVGVFLHILTFMPDDAGTKFTLGTLYLLQGRLAEGFKLFEERFNGGDAESFKKINAMFKELHGRKRWEGESLKGKSLLIITEQGAGDNLMMMRYVPLLKEIGVKRLVVYCEPHLERLFQTLSAVDEVISMTEPLPIDRIDCYCAMMSLPCLFQTRLPSIPDNTPYLHVPEQMGMTWRSRVRKVPGLKVGIAWAGNSQFRLNSKRNIPLSKLSPLLDICGVKLFSLQKGEDAGQLKDLGWDVPDWMERCGDYLDTAALVGELDLVISVDTSVAHLAGALGKPVFLLNRYGSEWRWMLDREDSPWYPGMKIFTQKEDGDWDSVIDLVAKELTQLVLSGPITPKQQEA